MRAAVIGGGAWGSALGHLLAGGAHDVLLWAREPDVVEHINDTHANPRFLPGATFDPRLRATGDMSRALAGAELVVYVAPSHVLRDVVRAGAHALASDATLVVATKGIERVTLDLMTDVVQEVLPAHRVVALSGPSFALEVVRGMPTAVVAASKDHEAASTVQRALSSGAFRVYSNDDVTGVEVGGALKNVMAVATGIAEGVGLGLNTRAALITRGLAEMTRLGVTIGA
ncbi:MAG TPA: NAD(P)H-dependent glycerol-3-phosphate dehydrogenase, partial [Gemmatimonadaceae bacterium]|nr:NAD(P)H-dependent glycerol-3-phosphate dehydrogenase [Gemmatimonadaceae bacterium]